MAVLAGAVALSGCIYDMSGSKPPADPDDGLVAGKGDNFSDSLTAIVGDAEIGRWATATIERPDYFHGYLLEAEAGEPLRGEMTADAYGHLRLYGPAIGTDPEGRPLFDEPLVTRYLDASEDDPVYRASFETTAPGAGTYLLVYGPADVWTATYSYLLECSGCRSTFDSCDGLQCGAPCAPCHPDDPNCEKSGTFQCDGSGRCVPTDPDAGPQCEQLEPNLFGWGRNGASQLGDGTSTGRSLPTAIGADAWSSISGGGSIESYGWPDPPGHTCGIRADDGRLYCWGDNSYGQLGDGTTESRSVPTPIGAFIWKQVSAGAGYTCGIRADNDRLYCWGLNGFSQLGDGGTDSRLTPTPIGEYTWKMVAAGPGQHTCGIRAGNQLFCWGNNSYGQIGSLSRLSGTVRRPALADTAGYEVVSVGEDHTCGIRGSTRELFCWGRNEFGQIGDNSITDADDGPKAVGAHTWRSISVGAWHTCGVRADHGLYCWGRNADGQLGDGTTSRRTSPREVLGDQLWKLVSAGGAHTCGIRGDDRLSCWGGSYFGQVGDGTETEVHAPVEIGGGLWKHVSSGFYHTVALAK